MICTYHIHLLRLKLQIQAVLQVHLDRPFSVSFQLVSNTHRDTLPMANWQWMDHNKHDRLNLHNTHTQICTHFNHTQQVFSESFLDVRCCFSLED